MSKLSENVWKFPLILASARKLDQIAEVNAIPVYASPPDLEADLALSDSTGSDLAHSVSEEILQLHKEGRMSPGERARTAIKTVWPNFSPLVTLTW